MVLPVSGSTSAGSMLPRALLSISPTRVSEHGVDDCAVAATGERLLRGLEGMLVPLKSSNATALLVVASWLKEISTKTLVKSYGEEDVDPGTLG